MITFTTIILESACRLLFPCISSSLSWLKNSAGLWGFSAVDVSIQTGLLVALYSVLGWWRVQGPVEETCPKFSVDSGVFSPTETFRSAIPFDTFHIKILSIFCLSFEYVFLYWCLNTSLGTNLAK